MLTFRMFKDTTKHTMLTTLYHTQQVNILMILNFPQHTSLPKTHIKVRDMIMDTFVHHKIAYALKKLIVRHSV